MGKKKTFLVDNSPVDVEEQDVNDFLKYNKGAVEARSYIVGKDTVDVALTDVADFEANVKNAKPLYGEEPKQVDPYAPKPVNFGKTTSVSPIVPEQPKQRDFTQLKNLQAQNEKWTNEKKVMAAHIDNMKTITYGNEGEGTASTLGQSLGIKQTTDNENVLGGLMANGVSPQQQKDEIDSYEQSLDQMTTSVKENNDKQIAILTKVFDKDIKPNYKEYVGKAGYGGIEVPNAGKVQEYTDNLMKEMGVDNADDNKRDFIKNAANQYIASLNTYERITPKAEHIFKQNTGKSIKEAMDEEQEKLYAPIIEIDNQYKAQSKMLPKIVDAQYKDEMAQIGVDAEHLNKQIEMESAQVDQHFAEMGKKLQAASVNMNQQQYDAAVAILNQQYKEAKAEKYDNYTMAFGAVVAQEAKINNQRKTDYDKQNQLNYNAYVKKRDAEVAKLSKNKNYSKEFTAQYEKAYNEAYDLYNSLLVKKLNKNQDEDNVAHLIGIQFMKSSATSLNNLAKSLGARDFSDGLEKFISGVQPSPKQIGDALEDPETFKNSTGLLDDIAINLKVTASDLFSKTGAATAGQIAGSGAVGMAMAAGSAYIGNALGVSEGLTMMVGGFLAAAQETHDIQKSIYNQVYANTNDVQLAEQASDIGLQSQLLIGGLTIIQMAKFMPNAEILTNMIKNPIVRGGAIVFADQISETVTEFIQNGVENAMTDPLTAYQQKTLNDAYKYYTFKLLKQTTMTTLPMGGQSAIITFASGAGKGLSGIQKYRADKLQQMRADALLSRQIAEMGDNFGAQQLTQFYDVQGGAQTITSITQLQAKGKITEKKATELIGALLNHDRHNLEAKKLSLQGSNLYAYTGLRQKQDEVERDLLTAATEEEKTTLNGRKTFIQGLINELTTKGTADIVLFRYKNGVQLTMTQGEATKLLMQEGAAQHIEDAGVEVVAMGKTQEPIQQLVKEITANRSKQEAQTTSDKKDAITLNEEHKQLSSDLLNRQKELLNEGVNDFTKDEQWNEINDGLKQIEQAIAEQSTSDNQTETAQPTSDTQTETQPQTAEERAAAILAQVKRKPKTEAEALQAELKTVSDQEERTNIGEQITLHETKAQHEGKVKEIADKINNLSENGKVVENLDKINALAADKKKIEESISDIENQIKTKQNERETKNKGREKASLLKEKTWHDLAKDDRITVNGVGASVSGVNQNMNGAVHSIDFTLDDGTKGVATILGNDILDANGKPLLIKNEVIQSEKAAPAPSEPKTTSDKKQTEPIEEEKNPSLIDYENERVKYNGEVGYIRVDEGGKITFENGTVIKELIGDEKVTPYRIAVKGNNVNINGDNFEIVSVNKDGNDNVVSVSLKNEKGVMITKRDSELALDIAIQQSQEAFNAKNNVTVEEQDKVVKETFNSHFGLSISEITETMPEVVVDAIALMDNDIVALAPDEIQLMLLEASQWAEWAIKKIEKTDATKAQKKEAIGKLKKFNKDLNKHYGKVDKQKQSKTNDASKGEATKGDGQTQQKEVETTSDNKKPTESGSGGVGGDIESKALEGLNKTANINGNKVKLINIIDELSTRQSNGEYYLITKNDPTGNGQKTTKETYDYVNNRINTNREIDKIQKVVEQVREAVLKTDVNKVKEIIESSNFDKDNLSVIQQFYYSNPNISIAETYYKSKANGTNPELVKAVEQSIQNKSVPQSLKETTKAETKVTSDNQTQKGKATSGNNVNQSETGEQKTTSDKKEIEAANEMKAEIAAIEERRSKEKEIVYVRNANYRAFGYDGKEKPTAKSVYYLSPNGKVYERKDFGAGGIVYIDIDKSKEYKDRDRINDRDLRGFTNLTNEQAYPYLLDDERKTEILNPGYFKDFNKIFDKEIDALKQKTTSDKKQTQNNDNTTDKGRPTKGDRGVQDEASGVGDGVPTKKEEAAAKGEAKQGAKKGEDVKQFTSDKKSIEKVKVKDLEVGDEVVLKGKEGTWKVAKKTKDGVDLSHTTKQGSMFKGADDGDIEGKVVNRSENAVVVVKNKSYADFQKSIDEATNIEDDVTKKLENHYRSKGVSEDVISQLIVYGNNLNDFKDIMPEAMSAYDPSIKELHDKMESATKIRVGIEGEFVSRVIDDIGKSFESVGVTPIIIEKVKKFFEEYFKYGRSFDQFGKKLNANKFNDLKQELVFETYSQIAPEQFRGVDKYEDIPENIRQKVEDTVDAAMSNFKQNILDQSTSDNQQPTTDTKSLGKDFTQSESASVNLSDAGSGGVGGVVDSKKPNNLRPISKEEKLTSKDFWNKAAKRGLDDGNAVQDEINKVWTKKYEELKDAKKTDEFLKTDKTYQALLKEREAHNKWRDDHYHAIEIRDALKKGFYEKAILNGEITAKEATEIIESAGLEVPKEIAEQSLKATPQAETTSDKKSGGEPTSDNVIQSEKPNSYKGIFNPKKTGIIGLDELLKDDGGYHYFYKGVSAEVVMMSPDEYLKKVRTDITRTDRDEGIYDEKKEKINEAIDKGAKIDMPYLSLKENGKAHKQEGRNRATIAKERGEKLIPVFIEKDVSFDDKIAKGSEYIKSAIKNGATTKEEVLSKLKEQGLHHDAIRFIDNNFDEKAIENLTSDNNINPSKPQPDAFDKAADATIAALKKNKIVGNADMRKGDTMMGGNGEKIIRAAFDASRVIYHTTKSLAEAIKKALKTVRDSDWYKNLSGDQKSEIDSLVRAQINAYAIQSENGGALKDVESTTKALDNLDETNKQKLEEAFGVLYHGSEIDFDKFEKYGVRIPALGLGYYFTPTLEKAKQYGNKIKRIVLKDANILDWDKLKGEERKIIRQRLESLLPKEANGLGKIQEKHFNPNEKQEALTFLQQKREQTKDYFYERGKARPLNKWGDTEGYTIVWADEGIENANDATLLGLAQQYDNNIAISLGYDGAKYGNETVVFDNEKIINATNEVIAEAYHKAKKDGSNPELVKAVEDAIATEQTPEQKMAAAKAELARAWNASGLKFDKNAGQNLGFMYDPNVDIKRQVDLFKALYNVAKLAIEQAATKLKNITAKDFIAFIRKDGKSFGNITDAHLTDVFNEANKPPVEELDLDMQDQAVKDQIMIEAQNLITTEEFKDAKEFSLRLKELYGIKETDAKAIYDKLVDFINVQTEDPFKIALRGKGAVTAHMNNTTINESSEDEIGNRTYLANSFDEMNEDIDAVFGRIKAANPNNWEKIIADKILKKLDERDMQAAIFADRFVTYLNTYLADHQRSPNYTAKALEYKGYRREILARRQKFTQEYATYFAKLRELKINNPLTLIKESGMLTAAERKAAKEMDEKLKGKKEYDASGKKKPFVEDSALDKAAPTSDKKGKSTSDKKDKPPTEKQAKKASRSEVKKNVLNALKNIKNNAADLAIKITKIPC